MASDMIKEHEINKQDDLFIKGYYAPDDIVNPVIDWTNNTLDSRLQGGTTMNTTTSELEKWDGKTHSHKECYEHDILWPTLDIPELVKLLEWVQFALDHYTTSYPMLKESGAFKMDPAFNYQKYPKGHAYNGWHCERASIQSTKRMLVWMMYLNECEDGGETAFLYQKYNMKPEKGLLLFWPSDFTHTHRGIPSYKTEKKIITGWYSYVTNGDALKWN